MFSDLQKYPSLIKAVFRYEHRSQTELDQFKAHLSLVDGSQLRLNEVWIDGRLTKYSYYWLTPTGTLIAGWDSAPHHPHIDSFPHHRHTPDGVVRSSVRSLTDLLNLLTTLLLPDDEELTPPTP